MNMGLKEFIDIYDVFCKDDFDIIVKWAGYNGCQSQLISLISALASSMVEDKKALEWQVKEWSAYAMNLVPELYADTDFTTCINALRLAYFAYDGEQYIKIVDNIMKCDCMNWAVIEEMHPMIGLKYRGIMENS